MTRLPGMALAAIFLPMQFAPSVYEHCAWLIKRGPSDVSRDPELLLAAQHAAFRRYRHSPVVIGVDIYNLEAEAYGARVTQPEDDGIPAILNPPLSELEDVLLLPVLNATVDGRLPMVIRVAQRLKAMEPSADIRVPVSGPFSILSNLLGFDTLLCSVILEPDAVRDALMHLVESQVEICRQVQLAGLGIAFFESAASPPLLSPSQFRDIELPALKAAIRGAAEVMGHPVPCVLGGDTTPILGSMLETGTGYVICPADGETDQRAFMAFMAAYPEVMVRINMRPGVTAGSDLATIRSEVERIVALGASRTKVCVGTGALPYETPPENIDFIRECIASASSP